MYGTWVIQTSPNTIYLALTYPWAAVQHPPTKIRRAPEAAFSTGFPPKFEASTRLHLAKGERLMTRSQRPQSIQQAFTIG